MSCLPNSDRRHPSPGRAAPFTFLLRTCCAVACVALGTLAQATPQVTITPTGHDFGMQLVDSRGEPFTGLLTNTGTGPMMLERFSVSNFRQSQGRFVQTGSCRTGVVLDTGASCTFSVTFFPAAPGEHFGSYCIVVPEAKYFDCFEELRLRGLGVLQEPYVYLKTGSPPGSGPGHLAMGRADLGVPGPVQYLELQNLGLQNLVVTRWEITGEHAADFLLGSVCGPGTSLPVGASCKVDVRFRPMAPGKRNAWLTVYSNGIAPYPAVQLTGTTAGPVLTGDGSFGTPRHGSRVFTRLTLGNDSNAAFAVTGISLNGVQAGDFNTEGCVGTDVPAGGSCTLEFSYTRPDARTDYPLLSQDFRIDTTAGSVADSLAAYVGLAKTPWVFVRVIEYYDATRDHYFIASTNLLAEIRDLDTGVHRNWVRTGKSFYAFSESWSAQMPVCRFYIPPAFGDSHFYSASPAECEQTRIRFPHLVYESSDVFSYLLPDIATGACPTATVPVYRVWNNRTDSNHRYTTETSVVDQMVAKGWRAEGYGPGPYLPVACAPPPVPAAHAN